MTAILSCFLSAIPAGLHPVVQAHAEARAHRVAEYAEEAGVPADREFCKRIWAESGYRWRRGRAGERGYAQVMERTGRRLCRGLAWRTQPADNLKCGYVVWRLAGRRHCRYKGAC